MFKPMLAPNDSFALDQVKYPIYASYKLDGIRALFIEGKMLSRSLKPIANICIQEMFSILKSYSLDQNTVIDGELYGEGRSFQEITSVVMSKCKEVPEWLKFHAFDCINLDFPETFSSRLMRLERLGAKFPDLLEILHQQYSLSSGEIELFYEHALDSGYEGLILKSPNGNYKNNRCTLNEGLMYKLKPFLTFDGVIKCIVQATDVDPRAEVKTNELGRSVTSKKQDDRIPVQKAAAFTVGYNGFDLNVTLAMTDQEKHEVWYRAPQYIGRRIEYKGMLIGSKDVPRHPVFLRFKDEE